METTVGKKPPNAHAGVYLQMFTVSLRLTGRGSLCAVFFLYCQRFYDAAIDVVHSEMYLTSVSKNTSIYIRGPGDRELPLDLNA